MRSGTMGLLGTELGETKKGNYEGFNFAGGFLGSGIQKDRQHYIAKAWGTYSHRMINGLLAADRTTLANARFTRIDGQITVKKPDDYEPLGFATWCKNHEGLLRRKVKIISELDGTGTVYIGSRTSQRMTRVYVKRIDGQDYLRFEVESKGETAERVRHGLETGELRGAQSAATALVMSELRTMTDRCPGEIFELFMGTIGNRGIELPEIEMDVTDGTRDWLFETITKSALKFAARGDDEREYVVAILQIALHKMGER